MSNPKVSQSRWIFRPSQGVKSPASVGQISLRSDIFRRLRIPRSTMEWFPLTKHPFTSECPKCSYDINVLQDGRPGKSYQFSSKISPFYLPTSTKLPHGMMVVPFH